MQPLISVIVPIYNVEQYLRKCIDSIINQTYRNLEIILVDDGSPDNCPKICDDYALKDSRVKVLHLVNGGAGYARNRGFQQSKGDFIAFFDSDDVIAPNFFESLYSFFSEDIDIVECEYAIIDDESKIAFPCCNNTNLEKYSMKDAMAKHICDDRFKQIIWNKLYRRCVVENVKFPEHKGIDDEYWTYKVIFNARRLVHINDELYAYRQVAGSVMHNLDWNMRLKPVEAKVIRHIFITENLTELKTLSMLSILNTYMYNLQKVYYADKKNYNVFKSKCDSIFKSYDINIYEKFDFETSRKQKIWLSLFKKFPNFTVKFRNLLKIGI